MIHVHVPHTKDTVSMLLFLIKNMKPLWTNSDSAAVKTTAAGFIGYSKHHLITKLECTWDQEHNIIMSTTDST